MLSLCELRRAAGIIRKEFEGAVLRRITQQDAYTIILTFERSKLKSHLLLSTKPHFARICLTGLPESTIPSSSFYQYLRAHLVGSDLAQIETSEEDRHIDLYLRSRTGLFLLVFSILGARSNVYLLDADRKLLHTMRSLEETRHELKLGQIWTPPQGAVPTQGEDRWREVSDEQYLESIAATYLRLERDHETGQLVRRIASGIKKEREFLDRKAVNLREDLGQAHQAEATRLKGELLKSMLHAVKPGEDKVLATEYQTGRIIEIPLDPGASPAANMESYFVRYQKELRRAKIIQQQLGELQVAQNELDEIERQLAEATKGESLDAGELQNLAIQKSVRRLIHRHSQKPPAVPPAVKLKEKRKVPARWLPKRYKTQDGLEIWVGRSDEGNDYLTTRLARGNDLFLHLEGYPGSHVILRTEGRSDPPPDSLLDACELAAHFSRLKNADRADVHVAPVKNVKKPRGAKPGLVFVRGGKTIHLRRDANRLQSILASRIGEE